MRRIGAGVAVGIVFSLAAQGLAPVPARAGVPRSCIHPQADAIRCPRDTRQVLLDVIPSARRRALVLQRFQFERSVGLHERERNRLLEQIRDAVRDEQAQD